MIVVAGEALVDLVVAPDGGVAAHLGGGPFNVSRTIARLGQPVTYLGALSTDRFGRQLRSMLQEDGVALGSIVETELPTTLALAELDATGGASYRFYADGTSAPSLEPSAVRLPAELAALHVGTLGLVLEPLAETTCAVVEQAAEDTLILLDPNCRPAATPDREAFVARIERVLARAQVVKISEPDLDYLVPGVEPVAAVRELLRPGAIALLTRGERGATVITTDAAIDVAAPRVKTVDTIGAGDAFGGAFLSHWSEHGLGVDALADVEAVLAATRFACLVAARTCERAGAVPPWRSELEAAAVAAGRSG